MSPALDLGPAVLAKVGPVQALLNSSLLLPKIGCRPWERIGHRSLRTRFDNPVGLPRRERAHSSAGDTEDAVFRASAGVSLPGAAPRPRGPNCEAKKKRCVFS